LKKIENILGSKSIAVIINDPRKYYWTAKILKNLGAHFKSIIDEKMLLYYDIAICEKNVYSRFGEFSGKIINIDRCRNEISFLVNLGRALLNRKKINELIVGVDPGKNIGFIVLVENIIVYSDIIRDRDIFLHKIRNLADCENVLKIILKIGSHIDKETYEKLSKIIDRYGEKIEIKIVDENRIIFNNKILRDMFKNKDILDALAIALT